MASLNSITQSLADIMDNPFDNMLIFRLEDAVIGCRAVLVRQQFDKTRQFPAYALYECLLPLVEETCMCTKAMVSPTVPKVIDIKDSSPFSFVGTSKREAIGSILPEEIELFIYNPVSGKQARYTYMNKKGYFFNVGNLSKALFRGAFADPRQLVPYNCPEMVCFDADSDDFIEEHMVPTIKKMVLEEIGHKITDDHNVQVNG